MCDGIHHSIVWGDEKLEVIWALGAQNVTGAHWSTLQQVEERDLKTQDGEEEITMNCMIQYLT